MNDIRAFTGMRGTVQWMAPEIFHSKDRGYDTKVDIWSVGCVLLEMWSGERPWKGEDVITVMFKVCPYVDAVVYSNDLCYSCLNIKSLPFLQICASIH